MKERIHFPKVHTHGLFNFAELCEYNISRKAGNKWLKRDAQEGFASLVD
jgi:hypothetical protein